MEQKNPVATTKIQKQYVLIFMFSSSLAATKHQVVVSA